ncbi:MAG: DNA repair protein RadA [Deltaproteobacteria bacterium RBG_19FT_COMBO_46_9]|nr:MAG: DNA repair protein RadA [Deltaproteobacteria bacterium RBG_19FT_COMBO_46_9]
MTKQNKYIFVCQGCGHQAPKWMGRCPECGQWNSYIEEISESGDRGAVSSNVGRPQVIEDISINNEQRLKTGIIEFDRALGGGLIPGSIILLGGEPGIGKSTLILQVAGGISDQGLKSLYLSGEESPQQIKLRARRLSIHSKNLFVITGNCIEDLFEQITELNPDLLVVDSIQTIYTNALPSTPGSVGQLREVSARFLRFAKETNTPVFLVGHVTKDGVIAGPKLLEHLVDTVLYFEGDSSHVFRIVRAVKNRYGSTNEIGIFEMKEEGLKEVGNPSRIFLEERQERAAGSVVIPCLEGTRPILVEIQALVGASPFGVPRRTAIGVDHNRVSLLVAVLGKRGGIEMGDQDIFVNVAGGLKVDEPAADLGIVSAMISSFLDKPVVPDTVVFGEVGLAGEIRGVSQPELRINEAKKLGFTRCLLSKSNKENCVSISHMEMVGVESVRALMDVLF